MAWSAVRSCGRKIKHIGFSIKTVEETAPLRNVKGICSSSQLWQQIQCQISLPARQQNQISQSWNLKAQIGAGRRLFSSEKDNVTDQNDSQTISGIGGNDAGRKEFEASSGRGENDSPPKSLSARKSSDKDTKHETAFLRAKEVPRAPVESIDTSSVDSAGMAAGEILEAAANVNNSRAVRASSSKAPQERVIGKGSNAQDFPEDRIIIDDWESIVSDKWITEELESSDVGSYMGVPRNLLPEIFFEEELPAWEELHPRGGCRGLEEELAASSTDLVMYRECINLLASQVESKAKRKIYLVGPASSGKSIAMAVVVAKMRAAGWLVMYIPEAKQLMSGGFFNRHPEQDKWDTPEVAKLILHYLVEGNPDRLGKDTSLDSDRTLRELAQQAIDSTDPHETVDLFLEVKKAVTCAPNSMIAVDNYQALHVPSDYGEWLSPTKRRALEADELRLAAAMRVLEQEPPADGVVLCAAQRGSSYSSKTRLPLTHGAALVTIPRFGFFEWAAMADYYNMTGATDHLNDYAIKKAYFTTAANPREYRKVAPLIAADYEEGQNADNALESQAVGNA